MSEPQGAADAAAAKLQRAYKVMIARVVLGVALFCVYAILNISAALTGQMAEKATMLLVLMIGAIFALPRRPLSSDLIEDLPREDRALWIERAKRIPNWLVWTRLIFFVGALFLFLGLPELVGPTTP